MYLELTAFLFSLAAVVLAEMGDKTQLLAMAFATKYKASKVMWGVFIATIFNHALAVVVGNYITKFQAAEVWIQGIAALSFVFFGLWTIRGDKLEGEENRTTKFGPIITVTIAFFLAEMGDKTQLATIAIATQFPSNPLAILTGTTSGMLVADAIGIFIGIVMCKKIPEKTIKLVSAGAFILFGFIGSYQVGMEKLGLGVPVTTGIVAGIAVITGLIAYLIIRSEKGGETQENPEKCPIKNVGPILDIE